LRFSFNTLLYYYICRFLDGYIDKVKVYNTYYYNSTKPIMQSILSYIGNFFEEKDYEDTNQSTSADIKVEVTELQNKLKEQDEKINDLMKSLQILTSIADKQTQTLNLLKIRVLNEVKSSKNVD
jgi:hypothetical protein